MLGPKLPQCSYENGKVTAKNVKKRTIKQLNHSAGDINY